MSKKYSLMWWLACIVHNCIAHPLMPVGHLFEMLGAHRLAHAVFWLHDGIRRPG